MTPAEYRHGSEMLNVGKLREFPGSLLIYINDTDPEQTVSVMRLETDPFDSGN